MLVINRETTCKTKEIAPKIAPYFTAFAGVEPITRKNTNTIVNAKKAER